MSGKGVYRSGYNRVYLRYRALSFLDTVSKIFHFEIFNDQFDFEKRKRKERLHIYIWNDYLLLIRAKLYHNSTIITLIKLMQMQGRDTPIKM